MVPLEAGGEAGGINLADELCQRLLVNLGFELHRNTFFLQRLKKAFGAFDLPALSGWKSLWLS